MGTRLTSNRGQPASRSSLLFWCTALTLQEIHSWPTNTAVLRLLGFLGNRAVDLEPDGPAATSTARQSTSTVCRARSSPAKYKYSTGSANFHKPKPQHHRNHHTSPATMAVQGKPSANLSKVSHLKICSLYTHLT